MEWCANSFISDSFAVSNQIIRGSVFSRDFQIEKIVQGNSVPSIKATWEFQYPNCYIRVTITFKDSSNNIVGETVITQNVNTITEIIQTVSVCNDMVSATFEASDGSTSFVKNSLQRVYTGGKVFYIYRYTHHSTNL